jgi:hypothetical protein
MTLCLKEVSLAHLVREVDVQPNHPGSSLQRREFGFLFKKKRCRGFPYRISFQKKKTLCLTNRKIISCRLFLWLPTGSVCGPISNKRSSGKR